MSNHKIAESESLFLVFFGEKMNRRTEKTVITVRTFQRTIVRLRQKEKIAWCERCAAETVMLAPNEAAVVLRSTARDIFRLTESGEIHFLETGAGAMFVCRNSLTALAQEKL